MVLQAPRAMPQEGRHNLMRCHKLWSGIAQNPKVKCSEPQIDRVGMVGICWCCWMGIHEICLRWLRPPDRWLLMSPSSKASTEVASLKGSTVAVCTLWVSTEASRQFPEKENEVKTEEGFQHTFSTPKIADLISLTSLETFRHVQSHKKIT